MALPTQPVTLAVAQVDELNKRLADMRHNVNNHLALMVAAAEVIQLSPSAAQRMLSALGEQPPKITEEIKQFSAQFEKAMGITR